MKCLKFEHPLIRIKHHYIQEVLDKKSSFEHLFPNIKFGMQIVKILDNFGKSITKAYKNQNC
jgi:hypothetical protein